MNQTTAVRLGVIGLGNIAQQHIDNVTSGAAGRCQLTAICSRNPSELAEIHRVQHFAKPLELIQSGLCDAVLVATPTFNHCEVGLQVLDAGLHLMMEKPLGLSIGEGEQLLEKQQDSQVFALMLNQRTDPLFKAMYDCVKRKTLGEMTRTHWTMTNWFRPEIYFQASDWRATWKGEGGGLLLNQCIHNLDIFQWLCGMPISLHGFCQFGRYHDIEVEDEATAYLQYENGATGVFVGSTGEAPGVNQLDIVGDKGTLSYNGERLLLTLNQPSTREYSRSTRDMFGMPQSESTDITPDRQVNQHALVLANFADAIVGDAPLIAPAAEGLKSLALANAMLLSTWESREITFPLQSKIYQSALDQRLSASSLREKTNTEANVDMSASYR
ncbi:MAG: Gfo/Idh/MocA family oxidoreductase [Halioglobus sp.]